MNTPARILCATDLTPDSDEALRYALLLAEAFDAELLLCYCRIQGTTGADPVRLFAESFTAHASLLDRMKPPPWRGLLVEGERPGEAIAEAAAEHAVDLIVLRSRRRPYRAALLGSTAETVSRTAPCSVFVTHPEERAWVADPGEKPRPRRILCAHDFSADSELALRFAAASAIRFGAELEVLHVLPQQPSNGPEAAWDHRTSERLYHSTMRRLLDAVDPEAYRCSDVKHCIEWGEPYAEILGYAEKHAVDMICMGAHGAGFRRRSLFGSNLDRVLRQAPCPAYVARPLRPHRGE
jgi:nucleotide-binding universal stress UspA family protein